MKAWSIPDNVLAKFPDGVEIKPNNSGVGYRWNDGKGNGVRIDKGNPGVSSSTQQVESLCPVCHQIFYLIAGLIKQIQRMIQTARFSILLKHLNRWTRNVLICWDLCVGIWGRGMRKEKMGTIDIFQIMPAPCISVELFRHPKCKIML